jgi:hypothetical protein
MSRRTTALTWCRGPFSVRARWVPLLALALVLAAPARGAGQTPPLEQLPPTQIPSDVPLPPPPPRRPIGQMKQGAWTLTPSMLLTNIGVDTNVLNSAGEPKADFTATVGPVVDAAYNSRVLTFDARATAGYVYYKTFEDQGGFSPTLMIQTNYRLGSRIDVFSNDLIASMKDRPSIEVDTRSRRLTTDLGAGVGIALGRKMRLELEQRFRRSEYEANTFFRGIELRETLNDRFTTTSGTFHYRLTPYTAVRLVALVDNVEYPQSAVRDGRANEYAVGVQFNPRALLAGDVRIGYRLFRSRSPLQPDYNGTVFDGRLMYTLSDSTGLMAGIHRGMMPAYSPINPYYLLSQYEGGIQQRFGRRFDSGISYSYYDLGYRTLTTLGVDPLPHGSNLERSITGSVGLLTRRWGRYALYVQRWQRRYLNQNDRNYDNLRFGFMITSTRWLNATSGFGRGVFLNAPGL